MAKIGETLSKLKLQDALEKKAQPEELKKAQFKTDFSKEPNYSPKGQLRRRAK